MSTFGYTALAVRETPITGYPKPRLLDRVRDAIRARHYSRSTEKTYVHWIKRYIFFHGKRHPADMGAPEASAFLTSLAVHDKVASSTQNQALSALLSSIATCWARSSRGSMTSSGPSGPSTCPSCSHGTRSARFSNGSMARRDSWRCCCTAPAFG